MRKFEQPVRVGNTAVQSRGPDLPVGLELVVYGSCWIGRSQLYCFPMKTNLNARIQEWARVRLNLSAYTRQSKRLSLWTTAHTLHGEVGLAFCVVVIASRLQYST